MSHGQPQDGKVYVGDTRKRFKLDVNGRPYPVGEDSYRLDKTSSRPKELSPDEWKSLRPILMLEGLTYEKWKEQSISLAAVGLWIPPRRHESLVDSHKNKLP